MQDTAFNVMLFRQCPRIVYTEENVYFYRIVETSAVHKYRPGFDTVAIQILDCLEKSLSGEVAEERALYQFKKSQLLLETLRLSYVHPQCDLQWKEKILGIRAAPYQEIVANAGAFLV